MPNTETKPRYSQKTPSRGGARPGAGRKKGQSPRYTLEELVNQVEHHAGMTFAERVAVNYVGAINRSDWSGVRDYDRILLGKMVADKQEITEVTSEDTVEQRTQAFTEALTILAGKK